MESAAEGLGVVDALVQLSFLVQGVLVEVGAAHQLSITQMRVLGVLRDRTPPMAELAAHLGLDRSSATGLIDRAERRGLVQRTAATHDRRSITVSLTSAGRELAATVEEAVTKSITALTEELDDGQRRDLVGLVTELLAAAPPAG